MKFTTNKLLASLLIMVLVFTQIPIVFEAVETKDNFIVKVGMHYNIPSRDSRVSSTYFESTGGFSLGLSEEGRFRPILNSDKDYIYIGIYRNNPENKNEVFFVQQKNGHQNSNAALSSFTKARSGFLSYKDGLFIPTYGPFHSKEAAFEFIDNNNNFSILSPGTTTVTVYDSTNKPLFQIDSKNSALGIRSQNNMPTTIPLNPPTGTTAYSHYGLFEISGASGKLTLINYIDLENYVKSVMPYEIGSNASDEVTKAFSILVRTVALRMTKHDKYGFDVCNQSCCQVYRGTERQNERLNRIVDSTKGYILTYDGEPISCSYNYSNGGASCSSAAAWGGSPLPYLTTVFLEEPADKAVTWTRVFTPSEFYSRIKESAVFSTLRGSVTNVEILETDLFGSEHVTSLLVEDTYNNAVTVKNASNVRSSLGLTSSNFTVQFGVKAKVIKSNKEGSTEENSENIAKETSYATFLVSSNGKAEITNLGQELKVIDAKSVKTVKAEHIILNGKGVGHGVGYSQVGAERLVEEGYDYAYTLSFFFPGSVLTKIKK